MNNSLTHLFPKKGIENRLVKAFFFSLPATKFELKHQMQNINKLVPSQTFYSKQFRTSEYVTIFICNTKVAIDDTKSLVIILVSLSNTERFS